MLYSMDGGNTYYDTAFPLMSRTNSATLMAAEAPATGIVFTRV